MEHISDVEIIAPNFKRRLSGVTSTIIQLVPVQRRLGQKVATLGPGLPETLPQIGFLSLLSLWSPPKARTQRIWHARRNLEMLPAIILRDLLRMKLKIVFTSASQRRHTGWSKFLIGRMDAVIATSSKTAAYLEVPSTTILHGIDAERFFPADDKPAAKTMLGLPADKNIAGCFGRIRHQKGTDLFVDAMIALLPDRPDWIAIVAGRATGAHVAFEAALKEKVRAAGLAERILFVGEHTNIPCWYRALDLFIAPQRWEGFGLTPLESMATGVPVVATDVGAFAELLATDDSSPGTIPGTSMGSSVGQLIEADAPEAMMAAAAGLMDDPAMARRCAENGLARATARFTIDGEARSIGAVYERLLNGAF
ncbi:glycosyltransferase family 4 protein [Pararhizobium antarcticum]|uniref:Glycosyl transferase family 1 n=1 Tax=Pararhizobium antarcticum TaxID=1798805 RepID=A0A657LS21_9HYPH|nr:glycosyltransferase family 4 protein [Pararhizobium antarcticum]OJF96781.1 glycosyl transferase family 1 [Pararhizobium antarcticum]OJF98955.1 glycosyl transferase family 1 [Rhizobium sp. 58]